MVSNSVVVLAVRKGNPKGIKGWDDLVRDDVEVITPNPFTSGGARWNVMAAYGAQLEQGKSKDGGRRVPAPALPQRPRPGQERARVAADLRGRQGRRPDRLRERGDHRAAEGRGARLRHSRRDDPDREPDRGRLRVRAAPEKAEAFIDYARSEPAQKVFAEKGYRSILPELVDAKRYPKPAALFTIERFGGWDDGHERVLRPRRPGSWPRSSATWGRRSSERRRLCTFPRPSSREFAAAAAGSPSGSRPLPEPDRAAAAGRAHLALDPRRLGRVLGRRHEPAGRRVAQGHARPLGRRRGDQRGDRHGDRLGARPRLRSAARRCSTP